jgi:hypothetical protein
MQTLDKPRNDEHEHLIQHLLGDRKKAEALDWLKGNNPKDERTIGACQTNRDSIKLIKEIYALGALEILAVGIHRKPHGSGQRTGKLVVKLPPDAKSRKSLFAWCKRQGDSLGFTPDPDRDESHLFLLLD